MDKKKKIKVSATYLLTPFILALIGYFLLIAPSIENSTNREAVRNSLVSEVQEIRDKIMTYLSSPLEETRSLDLKKGLSSLGGPVAYEVVIHYGYGTLSLSLESKNPREDVMIEIDPRPALNRIGGDTISCDWTQIQNGVSIILSKETVNGVTYFMIDAPNCGESLEFEIASD